MTCFRLLALSSGLGLLAADSLAVSPWDVVNQISQSAYTKYQLDVQNMGLGLYGGQAYNQGYRNRYNTGGPATESKGFKEATLYLGDQYRAMGLSVGIQSNYKNVVAELKGTETPDKIFIISGHYDHPENNADCPGGDDNASGTAGVLEAARVMSGFKFKSTIRFISWGGEEGWMLGSADYVKNVVLANKENVVGVLNLDMILRPGWDSDPGHVKDLDVSTGPAANCMAWTKAYLNAASVYAPNLKMNPLNPQTEDWYPSDQGVFIQQGIPGMMVAENTAQDIWYRGSHAYYHTSNDASDRLANNPNNGSGIVYDYGFATDVVRSSVGFLADRAEVVPEPLTLITMGFGLSAMVVKRRPKR
jgi:hypothetical protein